jgi:hypothetical protein
MPQEQPSPDYASLHPGYESVKANKWLLHRVKNPYLRNGHLAVPRGTQQEFISA